MSDPSTNDGFGKHPFAIGVEEELIAIDPETLALSHTGTDLIAQLDDREGQATAAPDTYAALVESISPVSASAPEAVATLDALRGRIRALDGTVIGAGIHPTAQFGDVVHAPGTRYMEIVDDVRGLLSRTPTSALHVHVGMPDRETAIRVFDHLRQVLPLLQALAANSPFWHGRDSGLQTARAQLFRGFPRADIPEAFGTWGAYEARMAALQDAGVSDYTYVWWDLRPHPRLGTVEVRAMDAQSALWTVGGLAALIHALGRRAAELPPAGPMPREALMESSFRAARDGLAAELWDGQRMVRVPELARRAVADAMPYARELGGEDALGDVERILREGNGAARQRRAFEDGGMPALLAGLRDEARRPYR